jgi:sugar phosphate isomerase/epimerase
MASFDRRQFLHLVGGAAGVGLAGGLGLGCTESNDSEGTAQGTGAESRFALCNEILTEGPGGGRSWAEQCRLIAETGYEAVEIAPFTLVDESVEELSAPERRAMVRTMQEAGLDCVGLHWLLSPPPEDLHFTTPDDEVRTRTIDYMHSLIDFCGDLGGPYMIFGSPGQRSTVEGQSVAEAKERFAAGLAAVGDHARDRDVMVLVEPLTSDQTDVVNTLSEAMDVVERADHPAISTMFDFHNTADETEPMDALIETYIDDIHHVQIQEMDGTHLGPEAVEAYASAFRAFNEHGYDGWISLEVFDFSPGAETIARESMEVLRELARNAA